MSTNAPPFAKYNPKLVGEAILIEVVLERPARLTCGELLLRIVGDQSDAREVKTATDAIHELQQSGLLDSQNNGRVVEPTEAAIRTFELLAA